MRGAQSRARVFATATVVSVAVAGCATLGNRTRTLVLMGSSGLAAGAVGATMAPEGENRGAHALLWGSVAAAVGSVIGLYAFDEEALRRAADDRAARLQKEVTGCTDEPAPDLLATNRVGLEKPLPSKFRNLITPGQWSLYKVDRWTSSSDSELVHQDLIFRFSQPQLNPSAKAAGEPGKTRSE